MHCSAVLEVADEGDGDAGDGPELFSDGEQVQECLRWVLYAAIATIDDRDW